MILLIDNYDSFVYNLARYFREMGLAAQVVRNDAVSIDEVRRLAPQAIVISPGPCTPAQAGISIELVRGLFPTTPILGICLGHQAIGEALGARVARAPTPVHGVAGLVRHQESPMFTGIANPFSAGRYHSLCIVESTLPSELKVTARTDDGVVMAVEHVSRPLVGLQFHPESVLTESGHQLLANFLALAGLAVHGSPPGDYRPVSQPHAPPDINWNRHTPINW